jgi:hypothetical protein
MCPNKSLVYGIRADNLVLLPENLAKAISEDRQSIWQLRTFGDARRFEPKFLIVPGLDEDDYDEVPLDEDPYDATLTNAYQNGDWPPGATTIALDYLPEDLDDIGEQKEHFPGFPTLYIDPATERDLVETLEQRSYSVRRDDDLIERIVSQGVLKRSAQAAPRASHTA